MGTAAMAGLTLSTLSSMVSCCFLGVCRCVCIYCDIYVCLCLNLCLSLCLSVSCARVSVPVCMSVCQSCLCVLSVCVRACDTDTRNTFAL